MTENINDLDPVALRAFSAGWSAVLTELLRNNVVDCDDLPETIDYSSQFDAWIKRQAERIEYSPTEDGGIKITHPWIIDALAYGFFESFKENGAENYLEFTLARTVVEDDEEKVERMNILLQKYGGKTPALVNEELKETLADLVDKAEDAYRFIDEAASWFAEDDHFSADWFETAAAHSLALRVAMKGAESLLPKVKEDVGTDPA